MNIGMDPIFGYGSKPTPRDYQQAAFDGVLAELQDSSSTLLVMPTGSGKTLTSCLLIEHFWKEHGNALFLAPRRELVYQTSQKLTEIGVKHGLLMAGELMDLDMPVHVACVPTLNRRLQAGMEAPPAKLVVIDEAHASFSNMTRQILAHYQSSKVVGMTATPARSDGKGLGQLYASMVLGPSVSDLTERGYLVPVRYFAPTKADLSGVRTLAGDYHQGDLASRMNDPKLVGDVIENWLRICPDRRTVVFAVNRSHAMALHEEFSAIGIKSAYLDGKTPNDERAQILQQIRRGEIQVICSVDVLTYGWDEPSVSCGIIARPTKSVARYLQTAGRILRPFEGKDDAILIDHSGVVSSLGFVDDEQPWSLDGAETLAERKERDAPETVEDRLKELECPGCKALIRPQANCPECGMSLRFQRAKAIEAIEAELTEIRRKRDEANKKPPHETLSKRDWYAQVLGYAIENGFKQGWAAHKFKEVHGAFPQFNVAAESPSEQVRAWCRHKVIKWAKSLPQHKKNMAARRRA